MPHIDTRDVIVKRLVKLGKDLKWLSRELGQNETYFSQFVRRGSPRDLTMEQKLKVADVLEIPAEALGVEGILRVKKNSVVRGLSDEAVPYTGSGSGVVELHRAKFTMMSDALENHPLRIMPGDILTFDMSAEAINNVQSEKIVVAQRYSKKELLDGRTIIRQFVRPGLLITNRASDNEIISLSDASSPYETHIKGVFRKLERGESD